MEEGTLTLTQPWMVLLLAIIGSGLLNLLLSWYRDRRKSAAETDRITAEARKMNAEASRLIYDQVTEYLKDELERNERLLDRVTRLEQNNQTLIEDKQKLWEQVTTALKAIGELEETVADLKVQVELWKKKYFSLCDWVRRQGLKPPDDSEPGQ